MFFLDIGGPNSLNNFASSLQRAQLYIQQAAGEAGSIFDASKLGLSPCTSPAPSGSANDEAMDFGSPHDETTVALLAAHNSGRSSVSSVVGFGMSAAPQTIFNSVNTLMGIVMHSLPFGFKLTGCLDHQQDCPHLGRHLAANTYLHSYGDIAYVFGGARFHAFVTFTLTQDLLGVLLSLVIIFTRFTLSPSVDSIFFKLLILAITFFTSLLPSLLGVLCSSAVLVCIAFCGLMLRESPGSLLVPAPTSLWPSLVLDILLSLGLFMAPWGGYPKYDYCCKAAFLFTFLLDLALGAAGYVIFGELAMDSLTKNLMFNPNYPAWVSPACCSFLGLFLATKLALVVWPVITVAERMIPVKEPEFLSYKNGKRIPDHPGRVFLARVIVLGVLLVLVVLFTSSRKLMAFFGNSICFTICMTLPLMLHLKLNSDRLLPVLKA
ncbi:hypothetical protein METBISCDRAFT_30293 [Metschnikowia bicuspidata]|uniref:Amino acid transporter transmembrane domain-containing protein n=1 Tax=Metschnikowia bicuspidata TaxID=27322 RepID=A0A4P9ZFV1_9ASCO|nr:hypothetical protein METBISCDRAFT_30293 [Metschnikowia bicuspidata]